MYLVLGPSFLKNPIESLENQCSREHTFWEMEFTDPRKRTPSTHQQKDEQPPKNVQST